MVCHPMLTENANFGTNAIRGGLSYHTGDWMKYVTEIAMHLVEEFGFNGFGDEFGVGGFAV